ncbi:MAG: thioesterase domain-containing protein [Spirochaetota bacterium]|nr:thioesterase domain-containing protein [Spirochaetota bacterium]
MSHPWKRLSLKSNEENIDMFCFPYSGGTAQVFLPFARSLPVSMGLYALEMPGRGRRFRENLPDSISSVVDEAIHGLIPLLDTKEYVLFGHSLGSLIAFETARVLKGKGSHMPMHIFVSGARSPQTPMRDELIHYLPDDDFVNKLKKIGGTPQEVLQNKEMLELLIPMLRNDFRMYEVYKYEEDEPLGCPITAIGGLQDKRVTSDDVEGWSVHTSVSFTKHMLNGDHFIIHTHLKDIIDIIINTLAHKFF